MTKLSDITLALIITGLLSLVANVIGTKNTLVDGALGMVVLVFIALAGIVLAKVLPGNIPAVAYVVTLGTIVSFPGFPGADFVNSVVKHVGFLQLCTPILAYAGISICKDLDVFKDSSWRIVLISCVVFIGTYLGSAVIAQVILTFLGQV
ncbi:DUF340 domain-containing protein [uncultured Dialister sp.]|uniref:DUF340 domain-containing protein n=1 Tax=uncultured Dialister sp. TaxID=278064 RepID=UPI0025E877D2|nr:DUF340 domain-containing protein [uncultured Dialister sp.]